MKTDENKNGNIHIDHRKRLKEQFYKSGTDGMSDFTLLEFVLFFGKPQGDTNILAHDLIEHFGSFDKVFEADHEELKEVSGVGNHIAFLLRTFLPVQKRYLEKKAGDNFSYSEKEKIRKFLDAKYTGVQHEKAMLINFDSKGMYTNCDFIADGDFGQVSFNCRKVASSIVKNRAVFSILVHNHPSGICKPSVSDLTCTNSLKNFLAQLDVTLTDSIILTGDSIFFFSGDPKLFDYIY